MKNHIIKFSVILFAGLIFLELLNELFNLPAHLPGVPVNIQGTLLIALLLVILISSHKRLNKINPQISITALTFSGTFICLIAEVIFQLLRQFTLNAESAGDRLYYFVLGTAGMALFTTVISFLIAFQLKTRKTSYLFLFIGILFILINLITYLFPSLISY